MINLNTATTAELVSFYNEHAEKPVSRFSDRKTAERRVGNLIDDLRLVADFGTATCPHCGVHLSNGVGEHLQEVNGKELPHETHQYSCLGCGGEFGPELRSKNPNLGAAIAASWNDPEVRAARSARHHVEVTDSKTAERRTYRSVKQAFQQLGLPLGSHIKFRGFLKIAGELHYEGFWFKAIKV